jgi:hypothetical protein
MDVVGTVSERVAILKERAPSLNTTMIRTVSRRPDGHPVAQLVASPT